MNKLSLILLLAIFTVGCEDIHEDYITIIVEEEGDCIPERGVVRNPARNTSSGFRSGDHDDDDDEEEPDECEDE